jgi:hypothetical protein
MPSQHKQANQHRSQARSARNVINALRLNQTQQMSAKKTNFFDWFKPGNFVTRLNDCVTFAYILDSITYIVAAASEDANDFISNGAPAVVNGIGCIAPGLLPFLPNIICLCQKMQDKDVDAGLEEYTKEVEDLFKPMILLLDMVDAEGRQLILAEIEKARTKLIDKYIEDNATTPISTFENVINIIYLLVRGVGGVLIMMKGIDDLDDDRNAQLEDIGKWMTVGSTIAYMLYYLVCLLPKRITNYCNKKRALDASEDESDVAEEQPINPQTSQAPLNSIITVPTLFSLRNSQGAILDTASSTSSASTLTEPFISSGYTLSSS